MSHTYSVKGSRQYRFYVCRRAQSRGWQECPSPSVPAGEIERFVVDRIKCVGRDRLVFKETLAQTRSRAVCHDILEFCARVLARPCGGLVVFPRRWPPAIMTACPPQLALNVGATTVSAIWYGRPVTFNWLFGTAFPDPRHGVGWPTDVPGNLRRLKSGRSETW